MSSDSEYGEDLCPFPDYVGLQTFYFSPFKNWLFWEQIVEHTFDVFGDRSMGHLFVIKHIIIQDYKFPLARFDIFQPFLQLLFGATQAAADSNEIGAIAFGYLPLVSALLLKMLYHQVFEQGTVFNLTQCKNTLIIQEAILQ